MLPATSRDRGATHGRAHEMLRQWVLPEIWGAWTPGPTRLLPCHQASSTRHPSLRCGLVVVEGGMTTVPPSEDVRSGKPSHRWPTTGLAHSGHSDSTGHDHHRTWTYLFIHLVLLFVHVTNLSTCFLGAMTGAKSRRSFSVPLGHSGHPQM